MNTHSIGYGVGVDIVHDYPSDPRQAKTRLVGFQVTLGSASLGVTYTPNSIWAGYIDCRRNLYDLWNKINAFIKNLRIRFVLKKR